MTQENDFKDFYDSVLRPKLEKIEQERLEIAKSLKADRKKGLLLGIVAAIVLSIGLQFMQEDQSIINFLKAFVILGPIFLLFGWGFASHRGVKKLSEMQKPFKEKIVSPVIQHFDPSLAYEPHKSVSKEEIMESQLFQEDIQYYNGDDLFEGVIANIRCRFSEKRLGVKVKKPDSDGRSRYVSHAIFKGIFLVAELPQAIIDTLIIRPNPEFIEEDEQRRLVQKRSKFQQEFAKNKYTHWFSSNVDTSEPLIEIKTQDSYFDDQFLIYSNDEYKSKALLHDGLKDFFLKLTDWEKEEAFKEKIEGHLQGNYQYPTIYFSIIGNKVYFGKPFDKGFFNPDMMKTILNEEVIASFYQDLKELKLLMESLTQTISKSSSI